MRKIMPSLLHNPLEYEIQLAFDDQYWIRTERVKTGEAVNVPLLDIPMAIIEKYKNKRSSNNNRLLPVSSNQKMNEYLKEIAIICNIKKNLSTHCRRHRENSYRLLIN